ncbi:hypothetical protein WCLP8_2750011 [uncultured Gammaproteobacteria bacterium]
MIERGNGHTVPRYPVPGCATLICALQQSGATYHFQTARDTGRGRHALIRQDGRKANHHD